MVFCKIIYNIHISESIKNKLNQTKKWIFGKGKSKSKLKREKGKGKGGNKIQKEKFKSFASMPLSPCRTYME